MPAGALGRFGVRQGAAPTSGAGCHYRGRSTGAYSYGIHGGADGNRSHRHG